MRTVCIEPTFEAWREAARSLIAEKVLPADVLWTDNPTEASLFTDSPTQRPQQPVPKVSAAFLDVARSASAHRDPQRWAALYRLLWRHTQGGERHVLALSTDPDVRQIQGWCKAIGRDIHKMHAFVRFRFVGKNDVTGREQFVAWFEPEHHIVRLGTPFFQKRFTGMDWSILTPEECAHWDGHTLHFTPGVSREAAPNEDALEDLWRTYFRNIFNPARLKIKAMQSEMPKKYWKNLPEAGLIEELIATSGERVQEMLDTAERDAKSTPNNAYLARLRAMNEESHD